METKIDPKAIFQKKITLKDGTELEGSAYVSSDLATLYIRLDEKYSMSEMFPIFMDAEKTSLIRSTIYSENSHSIISDETFSGYTWMYGIRMDGNQVSISMKKPLPEV